MHRFLHAFIAALARSAFEFLFRDKAFVFYFVGLGRARPVNVQQVLSTWTSQRAFCVELFIGNKLKGDKYVNVVISLGCSLHLLDIFSLSLKIPEIRYFVCHVRMKRIATVTSSQIIPE